MSLTLPSDALWELENYFDEIRSDYSGRGMFGKSCVGVVVSSMGDFVSGVVNLVQDVAEDSDHPLAEMVPQLKRMSTDNMGYDTIVYWPGVMVEDD